MSVGNRRGPGSGGPPFDGPLSLFSLRQVVAPASRDVLAADSGTVFFTTGATGAVAFTLPPAGPAGAFFFFVNVADQNMQIAKGGSTLKGLNNANVSTATFDQAGQKIGGMAFVVSDGASWIITNMTVGATLTLA